MSKVHFLPGLRHIYRQVKVRKRENQRLQRNSLEKISL